MATWWKKIIYSTGIKLLLVLGLGGAACLFAYSLLGIRVLPDEAKAYVDTESFRQDFIQKAGYLRDWIVRYDEETIFTEITEEQIALYIKNDGRNLSRDEAIQGIINDRNRYYHMIYNELVEDNSNVDYIAIDTERNRQLTNMGSDKSAQAIINELCSRPTHLIGNGYYILQVNYGMAEYDAYYNGHYFTDDNYYAGDSFVGQDNYRIYLALKEPLVEGDLFYTDYMDFRSKQKQSQNMFKYFFGAIGMIVGLLLLWIAVVGRKGSDDQCHKNAFDRVPFEVQLILLFMTFATFIGALKLLGEKYGENGSLYILKPAFNEKILHIMLFYSLIIMCTLAFLGIISSWIRHFKDHSLMTHIWCLRMGTSIYKNIFGEKNLVLSMVGLLTLHVAVTLLSIKLVISCSIPRWMYYLMPLVWNGVIGIIILRFTLEYKTILKGAQSIAEGELEKKVRIGKTVPILSEMAETINSIGTGLEKAVESSIKSERLKTELITNVSHDLKTPLTSIISYIDLIKEEPIDNTRAKEYIEVLDERSHRLKQLVEDLVEASKVVTGNVKAQLEILRLDELIRQAVGEYADRIEANGLTLVMDKMEEVTIMADGRHMWRIVENLLSNVCKYAMPDTRVYIQVENGEQFGKLMIKNISKEPLNMNPKELTERFVRGDASRTSEGAGLGLAIAQSLVTLQKGELKLVIDGDLFKVEVNMPKINQENIDDLIEA